ncbi:MarR family winged helix-turn-helix transcriptional regulator [Actinacidiphila acidipaludis]|uniref:MarR family transcriptional regulator n=1 Tax=Actinacidiphila acidipaludis TaxID=2873382 RepID=A0ABS7Q049_9ACTN|nr:MarR family transcriptional regulator [Streptomyces acidipaludis]MBY8876363.1 MarR family transcriptional regulator [Streptomyces acidipaludis]
MSERARDRTADSDTRDAILLALRRYAISSTRLAHAFASARSLQVSDLQALLAIISAEDGGTPLTPRTLRRRLGLSAGGTSYVIDRLEAAGHVRRTRDDPTDQRVVRLRHTERARAVATAFFSPLGARTREALEPYDDAELRAALGVITAVTDGLDAHLAQHDLTPEDGTRRPGGP